ncbi:hypothetical protein GCM10009608_55630 [Pseudonocardia alaniniphila]
MLSQSAFMPSTLVVSAASVVYPLAVWVPDAVQVRAGRAICSATSASNGPVGTASWAGVGVAESATRPGFEHPATPMARVASTRGAIRTLLRARGEDVTVGSLPGRPGVPAAARVRTLAAPANGRWEQRPFGFLSRAPRGIASRHERRRSTTGSNASRNGSCTVT